MNKALLWKEFRELLPLFALATLAQLYYLFEATVGSSRNSVIPFVSMNNGSLSLLQVAGGMGILTGLWQSWWESSRGTFLFLLHRPLPRREILASKLFVGTLATLVIAAAPMFLYALWAATPGHHASPFEWSMTADMFRGCLVVATLYFGAFLSGFRPAHWYASRFLPLAAALCAVMMQDNTTIASGVGIALLLVCLVIDALYVYLVLNVAHTRDFS